MEKNHLDDTPEVTDVTSEEYLKAHELSELRKKLPKMSKAEKLRMMDDLLLDTYITTMFDGQLKANDLGAVVTYLKNNKEVAEKKEESIHDEIDSMVEKPKGIK